ncbi:unnamed protein product [Ambrosiozyma monospora]|uniref:Endoplasmic reticulum-Golgi intermediate compartment protein n=1 Tax=Ambrosiozyma monospora TaxID=43982 RepID=A0A9W7DDP6_AMBMO|nr:unnamed protein product [Ambrosiozyma monospora]
MELYTSTDKLNKSHSTQQQKTTTSMGKGSSLFKFDAFGKSIDDSKIKTTSGGILTIVCLISTFLLLINEYKDYTKVVTRPELVVDRDYDKKLDINLDVSFPNIPCDLLSMDIMDLTGDVQIGLLEAGFTKIRLDSNGNEVGSGETFDVNEEAEDALKNQGENYCGSCYGAVDQTGNEGKELKDQVCCNSCHAVRQAYAKAAWKFYDGKDIDQCEKEGYVARINERLHEGCRVKGKAKINRISGNFHFAPGASISQRDTHVHDLSLYEKHADLFNFQHKINHFSFGLDDHHSSITKLQDYHTTHPLDGSSIEIGDKWHLYSYFLKVVNTRFEFLDGQKFETNEFSVTQHDRPIHGGRDDDHPNTLHARVLSS